MKLFIAAAENPLNRVSALSANNPNILGSYYHLTSANHKIPPQFIQDYNALKKTNLSFIMDSGLFTMMFGAGSHKTYSIDYLMDYTNKYLDNMNNMNYEHYIVEMDVHKLLGIKLLEDFRKMFVDRYPIEKTIFVWHIESGIEGFENMCKKYPYVAISIPELRIVLKRTYLKQFIQKMVSTALKINPQIKIHLLGCTSNELLEQRGYYSADSTSWQAAMRYGSGVVPHDRTLLTMPQMEHLVKQCQPDIEYNINALKKSHNLSGWPKKEGGRMNIAILSIAFYRHMAEIISRDYFNTTYKQFDPTFKPIIRSTT